jgi:hypothetical protein
LHGDPARLKSAVRLLFVRTTLLAIYPEQSVALFNGEGVLHLRKAEQRTRVVCNNAIEKDGIALRMVNEPLQTEKLACSI